MNYEKDIEIDESALDVECLEQSALMLKYTKYQAETARDEDLAKEHFELVKAELDKEIRNDPDKFDMPKVTESAVNSAILMHENYKKASKRYIEAKFENTVAKGAVRTFDQRKDELENLVRLHGQQYFAGPRVPRDLSDERQKRQKNVDKKIKIKQRNSQMNRQT